MGDQSVVKKEIIIIVAIVLVIASIFIYNQVTKVDMVVAIGKSTSAHYNFNLIEDYKTFEEFVEKSGLEETITINYKKNNVLEVYNEEYFNEKKLAVVATYEDTSKNYIYSIDNLEYENDKTKAIVTYTDKTDGYAGTLGNSWYNVMLVEVEGTVTDVSFVENTGETEK